MGLTTYEACVYAALSASGTSRARDIIKESGVPEGKIYRVLDLLQAKGLVRIVPGTPRQFSATNLHVYTSRLALSYAAAIKLIDAQVDSFERLSERLGPASAKTFEIVEGFDVILEAMRQMLRPLPNEVRISLGHLPRTAQDRLMARLMTGATAANLRIIETSPRAATLASLGVPGQVRRNVQPDDGLRATIIVGSDLSALFIPGLASAADLSQMCGLRVLDPTSARALKVMVDNLWATSQPVTVERPIKPFAP
ncbi:MAG: TrmB family transcriptional regulator [Thermoplasmatota archaeon]